MSIDQALEVLITEIKGLREDLKKATSDSCNTHDALIILGLGNYRYLSYFVKQGLLTPPQNGGKRTRMFCKKEVQELAVRIRARQIIVPSIKQIYK